MFVPIISTPSRSSYPLPAPTWKNDPNDPSQNIDNWLKYAKSNEK